MPDVLATHKNRFQHDPSMFKTIGSNALDDSEVTALQSQMLLERFNKLKAANLLVTQDESESIVSDDASDASIFQENLNNLKAMNVKSTTSHNQQITQIEKQQTEQQQELLAKKKILERIKWLKEKGLLGTLKVVFPQSESGINVIASTESPYVSLVKSLHESFAITLTLDGEDFEIPIHLNLSQAFPSRDSNYLQTLSVDLSGLKSFFSRVFKRTLSKKECEQIVAQLKVELLQCMRVDPKLKFTLQAGKIFDELNPYLRLLQNELNEMSLQVVDVENVLDEEKKVEQIEKELIEAQSKANEIKKNEIKKNITNATSNAEAFTLALTANDSNLFKSDDLVKLIKNFLGKKLEEFLQLCLDKAGLSAEEDLKWLCRGLCQFIAKIDAAKEELVSQDQLKVGSELCSLCAIADEIPGILESGCACLKDKKDKFSDLYERIINLTAGLDKRFNKRQNETHDNTNVQDENLDTSNDNAELYFDAEPGQYDAGSVHVSDCWTEDRDNWITTQNQNDVDDDVCSDDEDSNANSELYQFGSEDFPQQQNDLLNCTEAAELLLATAKGPGNTVVNSSASTQFLPPPSPHENLDNTSANSESYQQGFTIGQGGEANENHWLLNNIRNFHFTLAQNQKKGNTNARLKESETPTDVADIFSGAIDKLRPGIKNAIDDRRTAFASSEAGSEAGGGDEWDGLPNLKSGSSHTTGFFTYPRVKNFVQRALSYSPF